MTLIKAFVTIAASALVCGLAGCLVGYLIGSLAPDAYRIFLYRPHGPELSPVQFGVGQGLVQGLMIGAFIGVIVVGILVWREVRIAQTNSNKD